MANGGKRLAGRRRAATLGLAALAAGLLAGCTADPAGPLGLALPLGTGFDTLLVPLVLDTLDSFAHVAVTDPDVPFTQNQVLYLGRQGTERSAILARYDFDTFRDAAWDTVSFTLENIRSVQLRLLMLNYYRDLLPTAPTKGLIKRYEIWALADTLAPQAYPGPEPVLTTRLASVERAGGESLEIPIPRAHFLSWVAAGTHTGLMVAEGDSLGSEAGLLGFASRELTVYSTLGTLDSATTVGPTLRVEFVSPDTSVVLRPRDDVCTLSPLVSPPDDPADGFVLQTHRRDYPTLSFSLSDLPAGAVVNRALIILTSDSTRSYGPSLNVVCGEAGISQVPGAGGTLTVDELAERVEGVTTIYGVEPTSARRLQFDVTARLQRWINDPSEEPRRWVFMAGEDFLFVTDPETTDPDFYLARLWLWGTQAPNPEDRPRMQIYYTPRATAGKEAT